MYEHLLMETRGQIAIVTINNPKSLNALNSATLAELNDCLAGIEKSKDIRVVILTGSGAKAFVAGADISEMVNATAAEGRAMALLAKDAVSHRLVVLAAHRHQDALLPRMRPLLVCDVWEHAYYLRYCNNRAGYVDAFLNQVCWKTVARRFNSNGECGHGCCR